MYKIKKEAINDLTDIYTLLNQLEVKGTQNAICLANVASLFQKVYSSIDQTEEEGIVIDNTKKE